MISGGGQFEAKL